MEKSKTDKIKQIFDGISDEQLTAITNYFTDKNIQGTIDHLTEIVKNAKLDLSDFAIPKSNAPIVPYHDIRKIPVAHLEHG